jgi:Peptidase family M50
LQKGTLRQRLKQIAQSIYTGFYTTAVWILALAFFFSASGVVEPFTDSVTLSAFAAFALLASLEVFLILVHELGHATAAWLLGWRVRDITVLRLTFRPMAGVWAWNRQRKNLDVGGWVYSTPPAAGAGTLHSIAISAAGPLANLAFAALCLGYITFIPTRSDAVYFLLQTTGWLSLMTGVLNLLPLKLENGLKSDGRQLISLATQLMKFSKPPPVSHAHALERLVADLNDGLPPFEHDLQYLDNLWRQDDEDTLRFEGLILVYAVIEGNLLRIREILLRRLARDEALGVDDRSLLVLAYLVLDGDAKAAEEHLELVEPRERGTYSYWRSTAVLFHVAGARDAALNAVQTARKCASSFHAELDEDEEAILHAIEAGDHLPEPSDPAERRKRFLLQKRRPRH